MKPILRRLGAFALALAALTPSTPAAFAQVTAPETEEQSNAPEDGSARDENRTDSAESEPGDRETADAGQGEGRRRLPTVSVIGSKEAELDLVGSGTYVTEKQISGQNYQDINRVMRRVPGVYVREEDGLGLFPNISLRGVDTGRSAKLTIMEDGILSSPAPYSAPEAYYSPTVGRMSGLEVLKGSSQIKYGPHTTGGVINYLATPIPIERKAYSRVTYGTDNDLIAHAHTGDTLDTAVGSIGYLLEGYYRGYDGFRGIDETPSYRNGDETGMTRVEPMLKLSWEPKSSMYQRFEGKVAYTDMEADESYLGTSEADYRMRPYRRYTSTRFDQIELTHLRTHARHFLGINDNLDLTTTVYYADFHRNWRKLHDVRDANGVRKGLSESLAENGTHLATLRGEAAGELRVRNNNRNYYLAGVESELDWRVKTGQVDHEFEISMRYHHDEIRPFQRDELYSVAPGGLIQQTSAGTPGDAGNSLQSTGAVATYLRDVMTIGRLTLTPGLRYEYLDQESKNFASGAAADDTLHLLSGGIGAAWKQTEEMTFFGGVHRGVSPPDPAGNIAGLETETSIGTELGVRGRAADGALGGEIAAFYTHFDDLIVVDNIAGSGTGVSENAGRVNAGGIEAAADFDPGVRYRWGVSNPWFASFAWTEARCGGGANSTNPESIFSGCKSGNKIPYVPQFQFAVGSGLHFERMGIDAQVAWVDSTFTTGSNTPNQIRMEPSGALQPDSRFGTTDSYATVDISAYYEFSEKVKLIAGIQNLFDEDYLASRHPHGPRSGRGRAAWGGVQFDF
jgi:Fe(3+) dicitrate transport protein